VDTIPLGRRQKMRKASGSILVLTGLVAAMLVIGPNCRAEEPTPNVKSKVEFSDDGVPIPVGESVRLKSKAQVKIIVLGKTKSDGSHVIKVSKNWPEICPDFPCDGEEVEWWIGGGGLDADETLVISDADLSDPCFPNVPVTISPPNNVALSGSPLLRCLEQGTDHTWRYVVEVYKAGTADPVASTDPGAIIHP
jgi:hypothetical protein